MSVLVVSTFLAALALAALAGVVVTVLLGVLDRSGALPGALGAVRALVGPSALWLAAAVALTATAGSLFFSEIAGFTPCTLCWYQRVAMYPLVVILGVAAWRGDAGVRRYAMPVATIGAAVSTWHIGVERLPALSDGACSTAVPCDLVWVEHFGFVTIPGMALAGFLAILTLLLVRGGGANRSPETTS